MEHHHEHFTASFASVASTQPPDHRAGHQPGHAGPAGPAEPEGSGFRSELEDLLAQVAHEGAVAGGAACRWLGLDAFGRATPQIVIPHRSRHRESPGIGRTRRWAPPVDHRGLPVVPPAVLLSRLGRDLRRRPPGSSTKWPAEPVELLELAVESALRLGLASVPDLEHACDRRADRGDRLLARVLADRGAQPPTESHLETRFVQLMRRHGLTGIKRQVELPGVGRVDFELGDVIVETDGRAFHVAAEAFERDRRRWLAIQASGRRLVVVTHSMVELDPFGTVEAVKAVAGMPLRRSGPVAANVR